jgi:hypothetical protein
VGIHVETSIEVEVPVHVAYDRWMRCTDEPRAQDVQQAGEALTHWGAEIDGVRREWDALMARADGQEITWTATTGSTRTATACLTAVGPERTRIRLTLDDRSHGGAGSVDDADPAAPLLMGYPGDRVGHTEVGGQEPDDAAAGVVTGYPGARPADGAHHLADPAAAVLTGYPGARAGHTATGGQGPDDPAAGVLTGYPGARSAGHLGIG